MIPRRWHPAILRFLHATGLYAPLERIVEWLARLLTRAEQR